MLLDIRLPKTKLGRDFKLYDENTLVRNIVPKY